MKNFMHKLLSYKILMLMYFAGFLFMYLLMDLLWLRTGALSTLVCWQILLAAMLFAATHSVAFDFGWMEQRGLTGKKRLALHMVVDYVLYLALLFLYGWLPGFTTAVWAYTGVFAVAYAGLATAFGIYHSIERTRINEGLERFKTVHKPGVTRE